MLIHRELTHGDYARDDLVMVHLWLVNYGPSWVGFLYWLRLSYVQPASGCMMISGLMAMIEKPIKKLLV